jgi:ribosomal protein S18 acetylase RimI-like enzyme
MRTRTLIKSYENGDGVEVTFFDNGDEIGKACTAYYLGKPHRFLHSVEVVASFRNKGYGAYIVKYMISKYDVSTLYVEEDNELAIRLYKKLGFEVVGNLCEGLFIMERSQKLGNDITS